MNNDELMHYGVLGMRWGKRKAQKSSDNTDSSKKIIGNLTKKDAKNIGARFLGGVTIRVAADLAATKTGKNWIANLGNRGASALDIYNGYILANKAIIPVINNKKKSNELGTKWSSKSMTRKQLAKISSREMQQQQIRDSMDAGRRFTEMQLQQNNIVATNQIMGFY